MRPIVAVGGATLGVALIGYALLSGKTDEELIAERLDALEDAVRVDGDTSTNVIFRVSAVTDAFEEIFTEQVRYSIPELTSGTRGRSGLAKLAAKSGTYFRTLDIDFGFLDIAMEAEGRSARVETSATLRATRGAGRLERDDRDVVFGFVNGDDGWRIDSVRVGPRDDG